MIKNKIKSYRLLQYFAILVVILLVSNLSFAQADNDSVFNQKFEFKNDQDKSFFLDTLKGHITLVAMVYTRCRGACPITVERMKSIEEKLIEKGIKINYLLISFDSENDTAEVLKAFKKQYDLADNWHVLTSDSSTIRRLSVVLGVSYQQDPETKEFSHSNQLTILDKDGKIFYQLEGLQSSFDELIEKVSNL